jgi:tetratricopeptide (TPR) repeat protein
MDGATKVQILFLASSPRNQSALGLDKELRAIEDKLRASSHGDVLELTSKWALRPDDLLQLFNEHRPTIVHYSGHGSQDNAILLMDDADQAQPVGKEALARLFKTLRGHTRVVFFNACHSAGQAAAIAEHVDCTIGMSKAIKDSAAIAFASSFYRALGFGKSVREAFDQGILACDVLGLPEPEIPQLHCREGVDPAQVFVLEPRPDAARGVAEWGRFAPDPPDLANGEEWHASLSYRSADRAWVLGLYDVLRQYGLRVFLDRTGEGSSVEQLGAAQAGVAVWSGAAAADPSFAREYAALEARAADDGLRLVQLRLDHADLPPAAKGRLFTDFSAYPDGPNGGELLRLLHEIAGRPLSDEALYFASAQDRDAQRAREEIDAAILNGRPRDLLDLFESGGLPWKSSAALGCKTAEGLTRIGAYDEALDVLETLEQRFPRAVRPKQLRALALARHRGAAGLDEAQGILAALVAAGEKDPETLGIYGRTWLDRYEVSRDPLDLEQSRDCYVEAFDAAPDDVYTGVNAAAKSVFLGRVDEGRAFARRVRAALAARGAPRGYWDLASEADAAFILGDYAQAADAYERAVRAGRRETGSQESTWKQTCRLKRKLDVPDDQWQPIRAAFARLPDWSDPW